MKSLDVREIAETNYRVMPKRSSHVLGPLWYMCTKVHLLKSTGMLRIYKEDLWNVQCCFKEAMVETNRGFDKNKCVVVVCFVKSSTKHPIEVVSVKVLETGINHRVKMCRGRQDFIQGSVTDSSYEPVTEFSARWLIWWAWFSKARAIT